MKDSLMKRLLLFGYAPANKEAWPHGGLSKTLEALDLRHGVAPNLVMTPILSAACHLPSAFQPQFLSYVRKHVLEGDENKKHCRYNVLTQTVSKVESEINADVRMLFAWSTATGEARTREVFDPAEAVCLVFSYWAASALFSHLIEREDRWKKGDLKTFGTSFLGEVIKRAKPALAQTLRLPKTLPIRDIPRLGLYFRICTQGNEAEVRPLLVECVRELRECSAKGGIANDELDWLVSVLRSVVPLPHNEVYQGYRMGTNPIGKYQACFNACQDPDRLTEEVGSLLMWQYVGEVIAQRLLTRTTSAGDG
jgi:hypothetical protein